MLIFDKVVDLKSHLSQLISEGKSIGFVPTMGALHDGHASLIQRSVDENDVTVCSIFVNPKQFNNKEDLKSYPRDKKGDMALLESLHCDILFHPDVDEMYPEGESTKDIQLGDIYNILEGQFRPGHFAGVAVVVKKLFEMVTPTRAYFGLKDYQQFAVIKKLVNEYKIPVDVVGCETKRESSGLAMSSRNLLLSTEGKNNAILFYSSLNQARKQIANRSLVEIKSEVERSFQNDPNCELEYFEICDAESLFSVENPKNHDSIIGLIAGYVEGVRLIDNLILFP